LNHPPLGTFTEAVEVAEKLLIAQIDEADRRKRIAEYNAARAVSSLATST
jgi:hypothetical protein